MLADYGTGAIMAVPGARPARPGLRQEVRPAASARVVDTGEPNPEETYEATTGNGVYVNSGSLDGLTDKAAGIHGSSSELQTAGTGEGTVNFRLRDWLLSRQRYWGVPIPIIHCEKCGEVPVPYDQLPLELPELKGADLKPKGVSPLAAATDWVNVDCPSCGGPAKRRLATRWTPSWTRPGTSCATARRTTTPRRSTRHWPTPGCRATSTSAASSTPCCTCCTPGSSPRCWPTWGLLEFREPFSAQLNQGFVINRGKKMSKSLGNGVSLGEQLAEFGVDAVRLTLVFAGPPEDDIDWAEMSPAGSLRFLQRAWRLSGDVTSAAGAPFTGDGGDMALRKQTARTLHDAAELVESYRFNVMVARVMELVNATRKAIDSGAGPADPAVREATEVVAMLLSLVAPYTAEEMWERLGHQPSVARVGWPEVDPALLVEDSVTAVVQVQGKVRGRLEVSPDISEADLEAAALADEAVQRAIDGAAVRKVIVRAPKLVNIVL